MPTERRIVEALFSLGQQDREVVRDFLILGSMHLRKWDRAFELEESKKNLGPHGIETSAHDLQTLADGFTEADISEFRQRAEISIKNIEEDAVDKAISILRKQQKYGWVRGITQSLIAGFVYSALIMIAWLIYTYRSSVPIP